MFFAAKRLFFRLTSCGRRTEIACAPFHHRDRLARRDSRCRGTSRVPYFTNETIFDELKEKPESLLIVGGGPIGCELGQMFGRLGVKVTIIQRGARLLDKEDEVVSDSSARRLEAGNIRIFTNAEIKEARATASGVTLRCSGETVSGSALLIAAGRQPNVENLDLQKANVAFSKRGVKVDERLETTRRGIYAVGDVSANCSSPTWPIITPGS